MDDRITKPAGGATSFRGYHDAFQRLETPIDRVLGFARVQALLNEVCTKTTGSYLQEEVVEIMSFIAEETLAATKALEGQFLASHNAGCDAQHAEAGR
ncbi:hypothetical protein ACP4J4_01840 [Aureimonas ureilytica]|uniref:hypothetical protein n=1 Tax=Aureimonas ureilytica TaxID=401562 RepID=UPI003CF212AA